MKVIEFREYMQMLESYSPTYTINITKNLLLSTSINILRCHR